MNDALETFEEIIRELEHDHHEDMEKRIVLEKRVFRRNRDKFLQLLEDLRSEGVLNMQTTWYSIFDKYLMTDERFTHMLGSRAALLWIFSSFISMK